MTPLPIGTHVQVNTPNDQIYFGTIIDVSLVADGSGNYDYQVRLDGSDPPPPDWYSAAWCTETPLG